MILGLPWSSWLLLLIAVGLGFGVSLAFYLGHRGEGPGNPDRVVGPDATDGPGTPSTLPPPPGSS